MRLADAVAEAGSLTAPLLARAFHRARSTRVGLALVAALERSPGADALAPDDLQRLLNNFGEEVHASAQPLLQRLAARREQQAAYLAQVKLRLLRIKGDPQRGREVFYSKKAACAGCHRIGDEGGRVGPELTYIGKLRSPVDLVEAVIFPSSSITIGHEPYTIATTNGLIYTGLIVRQTTDAVYLRTGDLSEIRIPRDHVQLMRPSQTSIMPEGLEKSLTSQELADVLEFLYSCR